MGHPPYVLYRENTTQHVIQFITRDENNRLVPTKLLNLAVRFDTAGEGYEFGRQNGLQWWRVGQR